MSPIGDGCEPQHVEAQVLQELVWPGWQGMADTSGVRSAWGRGLPVDSRSPERTAADVLALVNASPGLFGLGAGQATLRQVDRSDKLGITYVELEVAREGLLPWRGGISARVKHGRLVAWRSGTRPELPVQGELRLDADQAASLAWSAAGGGQVGSPEVLLLGERALRPTWRVPVAQEEPTRRWVVFVDGETGEVVHRYDEIARASGTVDAQHHARGVDGTPLVVSPLPLVHVHSGELTASADAAGQWELDAAGPYTTALRGDYLTVDDRGGAPAVLVSDGTALSWIPDEESQAEIDNYVFLHQVKEWGELAAPEVPWVWGPITSSVRQNFNWCNAYWLGWEVHFFQGGGNCWETAYNADIAYHEWGHGLHFHGLLGGSFDLSLSEGASDTLAFLLTGDPEIARYLYKNGSGIRNVTELRRYPEDMGVEAHANGLIFGGSMWDLLRLLELHEGPEQGRLSFEILYTGLLKGGPDIAGAYVEALVVDDDDGDLSNGTPHICALSEAFGRHGLGPLAEGWDLSVDHAGVEPPYAGEPVEVVFTLDGSQPTCLQLQHGTVSIEHRVDGGAWTEAAGTASGALAQAQLPGQPAGSLVEYRMAGQLDDGTPFSLPAPDEAPFSYLVGEARPTETPEEPLVEQELAEETETEAAGCGCQGQGSALLWLPWLGWRLRRRNHSK